jgi:hypothetical protein
VNYLNHVISVVLYKFNWLIVRRERPAAISIEIKSIDDTSNFDEFPESDILQPGAFTHLTARIRSPNHSLPNHSLPS